MAALILNCTRTRTLDQRTMYTVRNNSLIIYLKVNKDSLHYMVNYLKLLIYLLRPRTN